jgi:fluoride exporter
MSPYPLLAVAVGAVLGAWLRWWLGNQLNEEFPNLPLGTLTANLVGGYVIGLAIEYLSEHATLPAEARLFVITGFCGALTTFSTFSAEVVTLLSEQRYGWGLVHIASHLVGSVVMTVLGILTVKGLQA